MARVYANEYRLAQLDFYIQTQKGSAIFIAIAIAISSFWSERFTELRLSAASSHLKEQDNDAVNR